MGGEAKRRKEKIFREHPVCCYCGGNTPATTIDHMPPSVFFYRKHRPKGLELPACERCNHGTSKDEQIVAMISRMDPVDSSDKYHRETKLIMQAVASNHPTLFKSLFSSEEERYDFVEKQLGMTPDRDYDVSKVPLMKVDGPELTHSMMTFGRKLTCAIHYYCTRQIIPPTGTLSVIWRSNIQISEGAIPESFLSLLGPAQTLKQGTFSVEDQFAVRTAHSSDGKLSMFFAKFRSVFAIIGMVNCTPSDGFLETIDESVFRPFSWGTS